MRKLYLAFAGLVPGMLVALSGTGYGQSHADTAPPPVATGNPGPSVAPGSAPKGSSEPQMAKPRPRRSASMYGGAPGGAAPNDAATSSGSGQSVAPGSAPKGSTAPQMAKPSPRDTEGAGTNKP